MLNNIEIKKSNKTSTFKNEFSKYESVSIEKKLFCSKFVIISKKTNEKIKILKLV